MVSFKDIWARIKANEGQTFRQIRGQEFTYAIIGQYVSLSATNQNIPYTHFEKASRLLPLENTVPLQNFRGPSYIYAILMDTRIRQLDY